jgi:hypothetical protein
MVAIKSKPMPRRALLRGGAGIAIGLPLLDAMLNDSGTALAAGAPLPSRFISWFFGAGFEIDAIESRTANGTPINPNHANNPHLAPFLGLENYVTVCSGFNLPVGSEGDNHHKGRTGRFSGFKNNGSGVDTDWGGQTIDQAIADKIALSSPTPIASIQVGVSKFGATDGGDFGTTAQFLSMRSATVGLAPEMNPKEVFRALFTGVQVPEHKRSILDFVADDLTRLNSGLGQADRLRIEQHLSVIRQVEQRLLVMCPQPPEPTEENIEGSSEERIVEVNRAMADLVALAFECDITRVASVEFTKVAGDPEFWQAQPLGYRPGARQHEESHSGDQSSYRVGVLFAMQQLSEWMFRLRGTDRNGMQIGLSNLLDSTILYASSDVGQGLSHTQQRAPMVLGGRGSKNGIPYLRPGQSFMAPGAEFKSPGVPFAPGDSRTGFNGAGNSSEVLLTCLRCFDPNVTRTANGTSVGDGMLGATGLGIDALIDPAQP